MATLTPELLDWISARSQSERSALLGRLARDAVTVSGTKPIAVQDEGNQTVGYFFPGQDSSVWPLLAETPVRSAELRRRIETPRESIPFDSFIDQLQMAKR